MAGTVRLDLDGPIATITNDNPDKHNAFDDDMDLQLFEILGRLAEQPGLRAVIWRAEGKSFSSGRDVGSIGTAASHGCIRMTIDDVIDLFDRVEVGTPVYIQ